MMDISDFHFRRFTKRIGNTTENGCWEWLGSKNKAYGSFILYEKNYPTHRLAWLIWNGEITNGLHVLHKCDNPVCVNPEHLFLGTHADNMRDMSLKGRYAKVKKKSNVCKKGHLFTPDNIHLAKQKSGPDIRLCKICHLARRKRAYLRYRENVNTIQSK